MHSLLEWGPAHLRDRRTRTDESGTDRAGTTAHDPRDEDRYRPDDN